MKQSLGFIFPAMSTRDTRRQGGCRPNKQSPCSLSLWPAEGSSFTLPRSSFGRSSKQTGSSWAGVNPGAAARALHTPLCLLSLLHLHSHGPELQHLPFSYLCFTLQVLTAGACVKLPSVSHRAAQRQGPARLSLWRQCTGKLNPHQGFFWQPRHAVGATTDLRSTPRALVWHTVAPG